jgi:hypothetical protein
MLEMWRVPFPHFNEMTRPMLPSFPGRLPGLIETIHSPTAAPFLIWPKRLANSGLSHSRTTLQALNGIRRDCWFSLWLIVAVYCYYVGVDGVRVLSQTCASREDCCAAN